MSSDPKERSVLEDLDRIVQKSSVRRVVTSALERATSLLSANPDAKSATVELPLRTFGKGLPSGVLSSQVTVIRESTALAPERHLNNTQRVLALKGKGCFETYGDEGWVRKDLDADLNKDLSDRWLTLNQEVWHKPVAKEERWALVVFHSKEEGEVEDDFGMEKA